VLSLGKVRRSGIGYYFAALGPRTGLVEADGVWLGSLAASRRLGDRPVEEVALRGLLDGVDPTTGEILDARHARVQIVAYDAVFAAPKSVSVFHALGPPEVRSEIARAHEASVATVLEHLEPEVALVRRRGPEGRRSRPTIGLIAAAFVHRTSRAPDPHLHTHVVLANLAVDRGGVWSALDGRALFEQQRVAGALYGSELRRGLVERLGLDFRVRRPGVIDIVGLSDTVLTAFSRRLVEIEQERNRSGGGDGRAARLAGDRTRPAKDLTTSYETLVEGWREQAYRLGVADRSVAFAARAPERGGRERDAPALGEAVGAALESFDRPFLRRELVAGVARRVVDGASPRDLDAAADAALASAAIVGDREVGAFPARRWDRVPPVGPTGRYVTNEAAARLGGIAAAVAAAPDLDCFVRLDGDGRAVVGAQPTGLVTGQRDGALATLELLRGLGEDAQRLGRRVFGVAPYAALAAHLEGLTGIVAGELDALGPPRHGEVVVVFGATRFAPRSQAALIARAETFGSAVVLVDVGTVRRDGPEAAARGHTTDRSSARYLGAERARLQDTPLDASGLSSPLRDPGGEDHRQTLFAPRLADLGQALDLAGEQVTAVGRRPVFVVADRALGIDLGYETVTPGAALRLDRTETAIGLVIVGGPGVLPAARDGATRPNPRIAVALAPTRGRSIATSDLDRSRARGRGRDDGRDGRSLG
jgi:conjugative relaxase-like TrwC/TraI family protein